MQTLSKDPISVSKYQPPSPTKEDLLTHEESQRKNGDGEISIDIRDMEGQVFTGTNGDDRFDYLGLYGDDTMIGSLGSDYFDGSLGTDTVDYSGSGEGVYVDLENGFGLFGQADGDTFVSVENAIGSSFNDTFFGSDTANIFEGGGGYDTFYADAGADTYNGGVGGNQLVANGDGMTINLALGQGTGGVVDGDTYSNIADVSLSGDNNTVVGTQGENTVFINGQDNSVSLLGGNDTLAMLSLSSAQFSNSVFDGGSGMDTLDLSGVALPLSRGNAVNLANQTYQQFDIGSSATVGEVSTIMNFENVIGSNVKDVITDNKEDNTFTGNGGADVFRFLHSEGGQDDTITDFTPGEDRIDFSFIEGMGALTGFDGHDDVEFGDFKIRIEDAVDVLNQIRDKIGLPSGIAFAYQDDDDVVIYADFAAGNSITLENVDIQTMSFSDFIL
jgi:Ca2+-binding RTX toxin-like protein